MQVQLYHQAIQLDQYLAVAYFQAGVSNFLTGDFEEALANFNDTLLYLRGNNHIDYEQLGLKFKLYSCEALFNRGLCYVYLQMLDTGLADMRSAAKEKVVPDHDVINEAIAEKAEGYTVFSIPVGVLFRPSEAKVKNVRARDYLGRQQVRLAFDPNQQPHRRNVSADTWAKDDRPSDQISYAATHLVKPNLTSRSRQQSEPPINRNMFPPTPPPESEKPTFPTPQQRTSKHESESGSSRPPRSHSANRAPKPERLDLGKAAFEKPAPHDSAGRRAPARSASERPAERRRDYTDEQDRRRLFGSVEGSDRAEDVGARLQHDMATSPTHSTSSRSSTGRTRRAPPSTSDRRSERDSARAKQFSIQEIHEEEEPEVVDAGPYVRSPGSITSPPYSYGRIPIANATPRGLHSPMRVGLLRSLRAKVHFGDDTRYVIAGPTAGFEEFVAMVAKKFSLDAAKLKLRTKDEEGDLITMADQEDFSLSIALCEAQARKEGVDVGKIEVRLLATTFASGCDANSRGRYGHKQ